MMTPTDQRLNGEHGDRDGKLPRHGEGEGNTSSRSIWGAPGRYYRFLVAASRQSFFDDVDVDCGAPPDARRRGPSVAAAVLPAAFAKYAVSASVGHVLRYALLTRALGVSDDGLPLVVGACDACCAALDVAVRLHGAWDARKATLVSRGAGPVAAAALYGAGVGAVIAAPAAARCLDGNGHLVGLVLFTAGSYLMSLGAGLLWNVWTQTFKHQAERRLKSGTTSTLTCSPNIHIGALLLGVDVQGKLSQFQVLLRYAASSIAPLLATFALTRAGATISYLLVAVCFATLAVLMMLVVNRLGEEEESISCQKQRNRSNNGIIIGWTEMLPPWTTSCFRSRLIDRHRESQPLISEDGTNEISCSNDKAGRFSAAFFNAGMFSSLTEVVRGGYTRIICLRVATSDLSDKDLACTLSIAGITATSLFWLSDMADGDRRRAASVGFAVLGLGHLGLALSSSPVGFYVSAAVFGLGEAVSTGLRALLKQDYLHLHGPLGPLTEGCGSDGGRAVRRQVCNKIGVWTDATLIANALVVGVVGRCLGMRAASFAYGLLAVYAVYFSARVLPDTKPSQ